MRCEMTGPLVWRNAAMMLRLETAERWLSLPPSGVDENAADVGGGRVGF